MIPKTWSSTLTTQLTSLSPLPSELEAGTSLFPTVVLLRGIMNHIYICMDGRLQLHFSNIGMGEVGDFYNAIDFTLHDAMTERGLR